VKNVTPWPFYLQEREPVHIVLDAQWASGRKPCTSILSLSWALELVGGQRHAPAILPPRKRTGTHCIERSMGLWAEAMYHYSFFNFGDRMGWSHCHAPFLLPPRKRHGTHCFRRSMDLLSKVGYHYNFFNFGARIGGLTMSLPVPFTCKKENPYPLYWTINGPLRQRVYPYSFFNFGARLGGWSMPHPGILPLRKRIFTHCTGRSIGLWAEAVYLYT